MTKQEQMNAALIDGIRNNSYEVAEELIRYHDADVIDEVLSKVRNLTNRECNPSCDCQPDCLYLEAIGDVVGILEQLKEKL